MTITTTASKIVLLGNGSTTAFGFNFYIPDAASLVVQTVSAAGVVTTLASNQYSVTGLGTNAGTVTLAVAPSSTTSVVISRNIAYTQTTDLTNQDGFYPEVLEAAFDKLTMVSQQLNDLTVRSIKSALTDSISIVLPAQAVRANKVLAFDGTGQATTADIAGDKAAAAASAAAALVSETNAGVSATQASNALASTLAAYDSFDDRYLGPKSVAPTVDNDGNPLLAGSLYYDTVAPGMFVYTGSAWVAAYVSGTTFLLKTSNLSDLSSIPTARTNLGLGSAAVLDVGTTANKVVQLDGSAKLPAVDGSQLTGIISIPTGTSLPFLSVTSATTATSGTGSVATVTFNANYAVPIGQTVVISGVTPSGYNGTFVVTASSAVSGASTVSFASSATGAQTVAGTLYNAPPGYLRQDGSYYLKASYPTLAAMLGTPFQLSLQTVAYAPSPGGNASTMGLANGVLFATGATYTGLSTVTAVANSLITSPDGVTWTSRTGWSPGPGYIYEDCVAYNGSIYVMLGNNIANTYVTSPDLATWTRRTSFGPNLFFGFALAYGGTGNNFVALFANDNCGSLSPTTQNLYTSTNGTTWTANTVLNYIVSVAAYSGGVVCLQNAALVYYSATGSGTYSSITTGATSPQSVSYANGRFIITASNGVFTSTTGASGTWTQVSTTDIRKSITGVNESSKVRWNGTFYMVAGSNWVSSDLIVWWNSSYNYYPQVAANSKFYARGGGSIYSFDSNAYNTTTQFPVPGVSTNTGGTTNNFNLIGPASNVNFIKT